MARWGSTLIVDPRLRLARGKDRSSEQHVLSMLLFLHLRRDVYSRRRMKCFDLCRMR